MRGNRHKSTQFPVGATALALVLAAAASGQPGAANAQEAGAGEQQGVQDIIVTAQKREENLQDVPVSVTALTRSTLENLQVSSFNDIGGIAPNVTSVASTTGSGPTITIRGIVGANAQLGQDTGVAMYLDGVYLARTTGAAFDVADIERVEVLRGPQGTLYGRNATGGAVNYITSAPRGELYARQELSVGDLGLLRTKTRVDLPKFGAFSISLNFLHDERNGAIRNTAPGLRWDFTQVTQGRMGRRVSANRLGSRNIEAGMVAVRYAPESIPLTVDYKFDRTDAIYSNLAQQVLLDPLGLVTPVFGVLDAVPQGFTTPERLKVFGHSLTATLDLPGGFQVKSITGYRGYNTTLSNDVVGGGGEFPGGTFEPLGIAITERERTFSEELQLSYQSDQFDAIGGLYYFNQHTTNFNPVWFFGTLLTENAGGLPAPTFISEGDFHNKSMAAFGQVTYHVTPQLDVTGGLRYTKDERNKDSLLVSGPEFEAKFNHVDWTANVTYRPDTNITLYAKAGSGYITGGINAAVPVAYQPEKLIQYEIGAKTEWFNRRLRANVSAFYSDYKDLQTSVIDPTTRLFVTGNAGKARIIGAELEVLAVPVDNLTLTLNYGYSHFKYLEFFINDVDVTDIAKSKLYRPRHNLNLGAEYKFAEWENGIQPSVNINARWHSDMDLYNIAAADPSQLFDPVLGAQVDAFTSQNAVWDIDARVTLAQIPVDTARFRVSAWVRNLLDKRTITNATSVPGVRIAGQFHEPRTFGVDVGVEF
ncbi:MAG TPA: TonB-dependent receptor [Sphingobium sp.]|nr:TonB-dependent receptor [Sphingobium sp.]